MSTSSDQEASRQQPDDPVFAMEPEQFVRHRIDLRMTVDLIAHPEVFNGTGPGGERNCYSFEDHEDVLKHLLFNLLQGRRISQLDGWADLPVVAAFIEHLADLDIDYTATDEVPEWLQGSIKYDLDRAKERAVDEGRSHAAASGPKVDDRG